MPHPVPLLNPSEPPSGPSPLALQAELGRLRQFMHPVSLEDVRRRQAEHDRRCERLAELHLVQMHGARREAARSDPWYTRLVEWAVWRACRSHLERVAWNRAGLTLHHWGWLVHESPELAPSERAARSAQGGLARAPMRAREALVSGLA